VLFSYSVCILIIQSAVGVCVMMEMPLHQIPRLTIEQETVLMGEKESRAMALTRIFGECSCAM